MPTPLRSPPLSPRMTAIFAALVRRIRDGSAIAIVSLASLVATFLPLVFVATSLVDLFILLTGVRGDTLLPAYVYPPVFILGLCCAILWIYRNRPAPIAVAANASSQSLLSRSVRLCARGPQIFLSSFGQLLGEPPTSPSDPLVSSFYTLYKERRSSSRQGPIAAALVVSMGAIFAFPVSLGLIVLAATGAPLALVGALPSLFLATLQATLSISPLAAARGWASRVADRLAAEGSAEFAAQEAALLDDSLQPSPKAAKTRRI